MKAKILAYALLPLILPIIHLAEAQQPKVYKWEPSWSGKPL